MKTALFTNFTEEEFIGYWDGKPKKFAPGQSVYMPDYLAAHFAKHLTNRELIKSNLETLTSPKKPNEVPKFMELFNQAYRTDESDELGEEKDDVDALIASANANKNKSKKEEIKASDPEKQDPTKPQVVLPPDFDESDNEDSFIKNKS